MRPAKAKRVEIGFESEDSKRPIVVALVQAALLEVRATEASSTCENSRPIADPICATSLAEPSRSRRAASAA